MEAAETYEHEGVEVKILYDTEPSSPREWDNLGVMYCTHTHYTLGDEQFTNDDHATIEDVYTHVREAEKAIGPVFPLFLHDHSGITIRTGAAIEEALSPEDVRSSDRFMGDSAGWDTSWVGFIFTNAERVKVCGTDPEHFAEALQGEVETYAQYLEGDVYGYIVGEDTPFEDSCWGYYGIEDAKSCANDAAEGVAKRLTRETDEAAHWAARDTVTI